MAHALIFGASGISGWAITNQALSYPSKDTYAQVTGLTNRPLSVEDAQLPKDDRLQLVSGVDLTKSTDEVVKALQAKVKNVDTVSHVFFAAYIDPGTGYHALTEINTQIFQTAIEAVLQVTKKLEAVVLQTGGKAYGVEFMDKHNIRPPFKESEARIPPPEGDKIFYYPQYDLLAQKAKGASWTFTEVRPDVIIGFVPNGNVMNCAQSVALYLSLYRAVYGEGATIPFPGTEASWKNKHTDTSQDVLAQFELYAASNPDKCGDGRAFNIADGAVTTWGDKWPGICSYFGLKGAGPGEVEPFDEFAKKNASVWNEVVAKHGLKSAGIENFDWMFLSGVTKFFDFDREYDLTAVKSAGFKETIDTVAGYWRAFDRMRAAKFIP